jgi:hypothetical protein
VATAFALRELNKVKRTAARVAAPNAVPILNSWEVLPTPLFIDIGVPFLVVAVCRWVGSATQATPDKAISGAVQCGWAGDSQLLCLWRHSSEHQVLGASLNGYGYTLASIKYWAASFNGLIYELIFLVHDQAAFSGMDRYSRCGQSKTPQGPSASS